LPCRTEPARSSCRRSRCGIGTATTEAVEEPNIRALLAQGLRTIEDAFEARMRAARASGEISADADPAALAVLASAVLHTLALRSRVGTPRAELEQMTRKAVDVICGRQA
jgi:TetR/AcrR family transcriptional regulator, copper-responsive repressor